MAKSQTTIETKRTTNYRVTVDDLLALIRRKYNVKPKNLEAFVNVPGGGDWSNTRLIIDQDTDLQVEVTETVIETMEE